MTLLELLDDCARKGIILTADGDKLHVHSSNSDVTPEIQSELRRHKPELLVRLGRLRDNLVAPARSAHASESQPLSLAQQSLWFLHQMDPATLPAYNIRKAFVIDGALDADRWADAFRVVVNRHAALRSSFERVDGHPVARISSASPSMEIVDLAGRGDDEVSRRIDREGRHTFDLSKPSLIRASLLRLSPDRSIFIVNAQHLVADAWSAGVVLREISETYEGRALAPPALSYHDYVDWQRQRIDRGELEPHLAYWKEKLADLRPLELPADHPRSATTGYDGASEPYVLPRELTSAIRAFTAVRGTTLFSTMLASFAAALYRFTGQDDFPIGTSVAGRMRKEFENVVGLFADLLVLRMDVSASPSFSELVTRVQEIAAEAFEHQDAPFDWIVKSLRPERLAGQNPLFQVLFLLLQTDPHFAEVRVPGVAAKFDLSLHVEDTRSEIRGLIEFKTALFERSTIRGFLSCWLELLEAALADPSRPVSQLPIVTAKQRHDLLFMRNEIQRVPLRHATIAEAFEAQAARTPDRIAVKSGDRVLTYRDLDERANRVAHALRDCGVGPEVRIGLHLQRSTDVVVAILGVLKAGGAYVPFDPSDPEARRQFMRDDSGIAMVIDDVDALCRETKDPSSRRFAVGSPATGKIDAAALHPSNAAYVIYTSGSTGQPRGVVVTHENVLRLMASTEPWFQFNQDDVWTLFHSYAFDFSVWEVWGALLYGGQLVIVPQITSRSPEMFHQLLRDEQVTVLNQTPSAFRTLIEVPGQIRSLRYVIFGGEKLDLSMLRPWFDRYGDRGPRMINMYGITETTVHVTWRPIERADVEANRGSVIGARIPDLTLHILDDELEPVPDGVAGHLHVGGAGLSRGYLNRPSLTAERFIPDPFSQTPGARLYRTGDLARRRHHDIEYLGRSDAQVKIRGFRIEPGEIEATLRAHAGIRECVVVAHGGRLIAYFIAAAEPVDAAALRAWCEQRLSPHMIPAAYVPLPEWPRTRNDKLDRDKLPLPDFDTAAARSEYVAPRNERQRLLADIWASALSVARVGIHDDFFALGGDSILSLDVLARMRKHGLESTVPELYRHHTVAELADVVREAADATGGVAPFALPFALPFAMLSAEDRARLPSGIDDAYPLSQLQAGMLFEEQLHAEDALYHDIFSFHLRLPFDETAWSKVLQDAVDRNATLRTAFDLTHFSEPLQLVRSKASVNVTFEDVSSLSNEEQERRIAGIVSTERERRFDYAAPPLLRFYLLKRAEDRTQVVFGFHHAILDGWSVAVLFSSVLSAYLCRSPIDAPTAVRYADYVADERTAVMTDEAFWKNIVSDLPATVLPRREDGVKRERAVVALPVAIPAAVSERLGQAARLAGVPLKTTLLAAHLRVLGVLTGMSEAVSGVVTNARPEHAGSDRVLGLFLNTLPVRVHLAPGTFIDLVKRTFDAEQQMLEHRRYPMAAVKRLAGGRTLFDAVFNFVHFHVYQEVMQTAGLEVLQHQVWEETEFPFLAQFSVYPGTSRVELTLIYDSSQFDAEQIQHIAGFYQRSLELRDGSLLPADEVALLEEWGRRRAYDEAPRLDQWFEEQVRRDPSRIAVRCEGEELSYGELDERANRLAHHLRSLGVQCELLVGLCLDRSLDLVVGILGILKAGAAYVPLDPSYPLNRLRFIIDDSRVAVVVTRSLHAHLLGDAPLVCLDTDASAIGAQPSSPPKFERHIDDAAYVIYTSGSTGQPKGVVVAHANVARLMRATEALFDFGESDVWTLFHSCAFDFSVWEMWGALLYGGRVVVVPYTTSRTPVEFHRLLVSEGVTVLNQTPSAFYQLMEYPAPPSLRCVIFGGEALDVTRLRGWFARHGDERPQMINMYGITETTVHVTYHRVLSVAKDPLRTIEGDPSFRSGSIGRPLPHLEAHVLDPSGERVPIGVPGELYVGGAGVARGYLRRDELTASRFIDRPQGRLYRTGDLVRWTRQGDLEYLGRIDAQVKIRGFRIELGEIEHALRVDDRVRAAAVIMRDAKLIAYFVADPIVTAADLRRLCEEQLPDHEVPSAYVRLEALPLTANGKLDRDALPAEDADALPKVAYVGPRNAIEQQLCAMWEDVLNVSNIGIHHGFFDLGGHSLHATQLIARVRELFSIDLPLRTLFEEPTIEKLAGAIAAQRGSGRYATVPTRGKRRQIHLADHTEVSGPESS